MCNKYAFNSLKWLQRYYGDASLDSSQKFYEDASSNQILAKIECVTKLQWLVWFYVRSKMHF